MLGGVEISLDLLVLDDKWTFQTKRVRLWHQLTEAVSGNPDDPTITLDPWRDRTELRNEE